VKVENFEICNKMDESKQQEPKQQGPIQEEKIVFEHKFPEHVLEFDTKKYILPLINAKFGFSGSSLKCTLSFGQVENPVILTFYPETIIGGGTYGIIVRYKCRNIPELEWLVKVEGTPKGVPSNDTKAIQLLNDNKIVCGQIQASYLGTTGVMVQTGDNMPIHAWADFNLLEKMQGDLGQRNAAEDVLQVISLLTQNVPQNQKGLRKVEAALCIVENVRKQILCLLEETQDVGVYTDMKLANILFTQNDSGKLEIKVGDLGSIMPNAEGKYIATYPCYPETGSTVSLTTPKEKEQCLAWQLGVLTAELLGIDVSRLWWGVIRSHKDKEDFGRTVKQIQDEIIQKINAILPQNTDINPGAYAAYLNMDPKERPSISEPLPDLGKCEEYFDL
jgi:hypothetical protein